MAYDPEVAQPQKVSSGLGGTNVWVYQSGDSDEEVDAADYFSDGDDLGIKLNDVMHVVDTESSEITTGCISDVESGGAATWVKPEFS